MALERLEIRNVWAHQLQDFKDLFWSCPRNLEEKRNSDKCKGKDSWWTKTMPVCWIHLNHILISESMNISEGNPLVNLARHWDSKPRGMCRLHSGCVAQREISRPTWTWNNMTVEASTSPWWKLACLRIRVETQFGSFFLPLSSFFVFLRCGDLVTAVAFGGHFSWLAQQAQHSVKKLLLQKAVL